MVVGGVTFLTVKRIREGEAMTDKGGLFEPTFDHSPMGMIIADAAGRVVKVNRAFTQMSGFSEAELVGTIAVNLVHPDDVENEREASRPLAAGTATHYRLQNRIVHRSGDTLWTRATVTRMVNREGIERYVSQIEDLTEIRRAKAMFEHHELHDRLTGLPNRTALLRQLSLTLKTADAVTPALACLYLDIDHLTRVNDSLGHSAGDVLLVEIARRIRSAARPGDIVARLGGDEFVIIAPRLAGESAAQQLMSRICTAVQAPIDVDGHEVVTTLSGGLALAKPGISAETLVRNADTAVSHAKESGRNRVETYTESLRELALARLSVEAELRTAIRWRQLVVHYQPIVDLRSERPVAYEALVRWNHPNRGLLHPGDFLEEMEEANLMVPLGTFVLHEACQFIADHPEFLGQVFVNVSSNQVGGANLARVVEEVLAETGVDASRLALEITESGMLLASPVEQADLAALIDLGVELVIDDFGTGYSSLSSVLRNPVAGIKLARDFTVRLGDDSSGDQISAAIASLANDLDVYGVIEGIETKEQHQLALTHGWRYGQGYLFGSPTPPERSLIETDKRDHAPVAAIPQSAAGTPRNKRSF